MTKASLLVVIVVMIAMASHSHLWTLAPASPTRISTVLVLCKKQLVVLPETTIIPTSGVR
jgi:hypothetical protein